MVSTVNIGLFSTEIHQISYFLFCHTLPNFFINSSVLEFR